MTAAAYYSYNPGEEIQLFNIGNESEPSSYRQIALIPLHTPETESLGVAVDLTWVRSIFYHEYWSDKAPAGKHTQENTLTLAKPADARKRLWPLVPLKTADLPFFEALFGRDAATQPENSTIGHVSLAELGLRFDDGVKTTVMQFPELVALIDGTVFRFPETYFIGDMAAVAANLPLNYNPDWFRTFNGLPTAWVGCCCELCGSRNEYVRHIIGPSRIVCCQECGLEYDNPRAIITKPSLDKYASVISDQRNSAKSMVRAQQGAEIVISGLNAIAPHLFGKPLLDLGCASGELLRVLRDDHHWPNKYLCGVEPSALAADVANSAHGVKVIAGELLDAHLESGSFSVIVIMNTIEHIANPSRILAEVKRLLAPGGCVLIGTVPNAGCLAARSFPGGFIAKNFPDGHHHFHYTPDTLSQLCINCGLKPIRLDGETRESVLGKIKETAIWLSYSCGVPLSQCSNEAPMLAQMKRTLQDIQEKILEPLGTHYRFILRDKNFIDLPSLVRFWQQEIWPSPYLSDEFDLWLTSTEKIVGNTDKHKNLPPYPGFISRFQKNMDILDLLDKT